MTEEANDVVETRIQFHRDNCRYPVIAIIASVFFASILAYFLGGALWVLLGLPLLAGFGYWFCYNSIRRHGLLCGGCKANFLANPPVRNDGRCPKCEEVIVEADI